MDDNKKLVQETNSVFIFDKIRTLLALKFNYSGKELINKVEEYVKNNFSDFNKIESALKDYKKPEIEEQYLHPDKNLVDEYYFYDSSNFINSLISSALIPFDYWNIYQYENYSIYPKYFKGKQIQGYLSNSKEIGLYMYEKYNSAIGFSIFTSNLEDDYNSVCKSHPFRKINKIIEEKLILNGKKVEKYLFDLQGFYNEDKLEELLKNRDDMIINIYDINETDTSRFYFESIKVLDLSFYKEIKNLKEDKRYKKKHEDYCADCFDEHQDYQLYYLDDNLSREKFWEEMGPVVTKFFIERYSEHLRYSDYVKFIKGKNPAIE